MIEQKKNRGEPEERKRNRSVFGQKSREKKEKIRIYEYVVHIRHLRTQRLDVCVYIYTFKRSYSSRLYFFLLFRQRDAKGQSSV